MLCLACPAIATTDITADGHAQGSTTVMANCTNTYLGSYEGPVDFEAKWTANPYTITYKPGYGKAGSEARAATGTDKVVNVSYDEQNLTALANTAANFGTAYSLTGYTFDGWKADHNINGVNSGTAGASTPVTNDYTSGGTNYDAGAPLSPYNVVGNTIMYAQWKPNCNGAFTLDSNKYNAAGTSVDYPISSNPSGLYVKYDVGFFKAGCSTTQAITVPTLTGYGFEGYYTAKSGGTQMIDSTGAATADGKTAITPTTWYAHWQANKHRFNYDCGTAPTVTGLNISIASGATPPTYGSIYYDTPNVVISAEPGTCALNGDRGGFRFDGWECTVDPDDGVGTARYEPNCNGNVCSFSHTVSKWKADDDVTCVAKWRGKTYNITYDKGTAGSRTTGFSGSTAAQSVEFSRSVTLNANGFSIPGYTFNGWKGDYDNATGNETETSYSNSATINPYKIAHDLALTAQWKANVTTIEYNCGSAGNASTTLTSNAPANGTATYDSNFEFATPTSSQCKLPGYNGKWVCTGAANTTGLNANGYDFGATVTPWAYTGADGQTITCTANWTARPYKITYKPGTAGSRTVQGDDIMRAVNFDGTTYTDTTGGALKTLASDTYSITGYDFKEWSSDHNISTGAATTTVYNANTSISPYHVQDSTVMTAKWTAHTYSDAVTYSCGDGEQKSGVTSGDMVSAFTYDASYSLKSVSNLCKKDGYHVKTTGTNNISGWVCKLNSGTSYLAAASGTWTYTNSYTCEAQWEANVIDLTWYRNHSSSDTTTQTGNNSGNCTYGNGINLPTEPSRTGYTFNGWHVRSAGQ